MHDFTLLFRLFLYSGCIHQEQESADKMNLLPLYTLVGGLALMVGVFMGKRAFLVIIHARANVRLRNFEAQLLTLHNAVEEISMWQWILSAVVMDLSTVTQISPVIAAAGRMFCS